jgi:hypothetical protein
MEKVKIEFRGQEVEIPASDLEHFLEKGAKKVGGAAPKKAPVKREAAPKKDKK